MSSFSDTFFAVERAAASVYHNVLATGVAVIDWEEDHPDIAPFVRAGLRYAVAAVARTGVPVEAIMILAPDVIAALKCLAAHDATVPSVPVTTVTTSSLTAIA